MAMTDFTIIRRSMSARMFSTVTTIITVAVAVSLLLVLLTMGDSARSAFERGSGNAHLVLGAEPDPLTVVLNNVFYARAPRNPIPWARYQQIRAGLPIAQGDAPRTRHRRRLRHPHPARRQLPRPARHGHHPRVLLPLHAAGRATVGLHPGPALRGRLRGRPRRCRRAGRPASRSATASRSRTAPAIPAAMSTTNTPFKVVGILAPTASPHDRALFTNLQSAWIIHAQDRPRAGARPGRRPRS